MEINNLSNLNIEEISIVDIPAVEDAKFIILKRDNKELEKMKASTLEKKEGEDLKKKEEEEEEEETSTEKVVASVKSASIEAADALEKVLDKASEKEKKRLTLIIANLRSLAGVKKDLTEDEDIEKIGRKLSRETMANIEKIISSLSSVVSELQKLKVEPVLEEDYGYPARQEDNYKKKDELRSNLLKVVDAYKAGFLESDELKHLLEQI